MTAPTRFEAATVELAGKNLVEASAGTGKTYAITTLFVRLLLEQGLEPSQIAVVTFTEAATAELRDRIRKRLVETEAAFRLAAAGQKPADATLAIMTQARATHLGPDLVRLRAAIENVDEAVISTIHGFCHRMLHENAFGTRSLFDVEFATDLDDVRDDLVYDFWHQTLARGSLAEAEMLSRLGIDVGWLRELVDAQRRNPSVRIEPGAPKNAPAIDAALAEVRRHAAIVPLREHLKKRVTLSNLGIAKATPEQVDDIILGRSMALPKDAACLFPEALIGAWKTTKKAPAVEIHPFFPAWERFARACLERAIALSHDLLKNAPGELARRKDTRGVLGFEDLLMQLALAVRGSPGTALVHALRARFHATLIDEFQDTDPVQLEIFDTAYGDGKRPMFMIGDPKQSIYAFRGGDVFTYLAGAEGARRYGMAMNWRSDQGLVRAVNRLFSKPAVFANPGISYTSVEAAERATNAFSVAAPASVAPFRISVLARQDPSKPLTKPVARSAVARVVAADVVRLLRDGATLTIDGKERRVVEGDIAILTRTNRQCQYVQEALAKRGVHAVLMGDQTVFESEEATDLRRLLGAVLDPTSAFELKRALSTRIVGHVAEDLVKLEEDPTAWNEWAARFRRWNDSWTRHGFMRMFREVLDETKSVATLLRTHDGERALTNLLHLGELLHRASTEEHLGPTGLVQWLREQQKETGAAKTEHAEIRLESDATAVRILTVHKAKGLEFGIVYCPYLWDSFSGASVRPFIYHDDSGAAVLHIGIDAVAREQAVTRAKQETGAEEVRVAYVALTRAKHRCVMLWGGFNGADKSAAARLLHTDAGIAKGTDDELLADLGVLSDASDGDIEVVPVPWDDDEPRLSPALVATTVDDARRARRVSSWLRTSSFSALIKKDDQPIVIAPIDPADETGADHDETDAADELVDDASHSSPSPSPAPATPDGERALPIVPETFPKGRLTGDFFHKVFELVDFAELDAADLDRIIDEQVREYGLARGVAQLATLRAEAAQLVRETLATPLVAGTGLSLGRVTRHTRLNELEFHLPVTEPLSTERLARVFSDHPGDAFPADYADRVSRLGFRELSGYLKGVIDLVFECDGRYYVADYKTNHLGYFAEEYDRAAMTEKMAEAHYVLQYHLYALAVDRYLRLTVTDYEYERHFGGVLYLFVKGMRPGAPAGSGVFFEKPPIARMGALSRAFGEEAAWR